MSYTTLQSHIHTHTRVSFALAAMPQVYDIDTHVPHDFVVLFFSYLFFLLLSISLLLEFSEEDTGHMVMMALHPSFWRFVNQSIESSIEFPFLNFNRT